jgi:hypothetical protein
MKLILDKEFEELESSTRDTTSPSQHTDKKKEIRKLLLTIFFNNKLQNLILHLETLPQDCRIAVILLYQLIQKN